MNEHARGAPIEVVVEMARADAAGDPYAFRFSEQAYSMRSEDGSYETAVFSWGSDVLEDMDRIQRAKPDRAAMQRMGDRLRAFLEAGSLDVRRGRIEDAIDAGRRVDVTFRSAAAELYALPWELVTRRATGQHIGEIEQVCIHYEWPSVKPKARSPEPPPACAPILFAWSAAGGAVPAAEHLAAIRDAARAGSYPFDEARDVLPHASLRALREALEAGVADRAPCVLHLLCHGGATASDTPTYGLALDGAGEGDGAEIVDAGALRQALEPFASSLALVVLAACQGAASGDLGNHLGSVAQALHRVGIPAVIASRYPLSIEGSIILTKALYAELLVELGSLERAFLRARRSLVSRPERVDWAAIQLVGSTSHGEQLWPITRRPYRGLLPFRPEDHRLFFGRSRDVERVVGALRRGQRCVTVLGASGSGKSSLVLAGVVPALQRGESQAARASDVAEPGAGLGRPLLVSVLRPGVSPCASLAAALSRLGGAGRGPQGGAPGPSMEARLRESPSAFAEIARAALEPGAGLVVVVDQFEEIFTQSREVADAQAFVANLLRAIDALDGALRVIFTLRADFLSNCLGFSMELSDRIRDTIEIAMPMGDDQLREAIEGPAAALGLRFEAGLVDAIVSAVRDDAGLRAPGAAARGANLPHAQFALDALWERRKGGWLTFDAFRAMGGVQGALARKAESMLPGRERAAELDIVKAIFGRLVLVGEGTADTRRYASRAELSVIAPGKVEPILERWIASRLLIADDAQVWLAQEALLREWATLRSWIDEGREALRVRQEVGHEAAHWIEGGRLDDDLLRGGRLRRAMELLEAKMLALAPEEQAFLDASEAREARLRGEESAREARERDKEMDRQKRARRRAAWIAAGATLIAAVFAAFGAWAMRENQAALEARDRAAREASEARAALLKVSSERCPSAPAAPHP